MSNRLFQSIIVQLGEASGRVIGVLDEESVVIACSNLPSIGEVRSGIKERYSGKSESIKLNGFTYCFAGEGRRTEYAVFVEGTERDAEQLSRMTLVSLAGIKYYHDERYDRGTFIKNVVMDNILPGEVYTKARELKFKTDVQRVALLVRVTTGEIMNAYDIIVKLFPDKNKDFIFSVSETDLVIIKEIGSGIDLKNIEKLASSIVDMLTGDYYINSVVGIGTMVGSVNELATSFKEAQVALEVGKVFDTEHSIISYDNLGIARLVYQLPTTLCEMFLKEVFKKGSTDSLDQETLFTIQRFFENNLNVSETSRGLFVHRNTLVYRLEKIKKLTGLDLRQFDHAIIFKVAMMVKKYLDANPVKY